MKNVEGKVQKDLPLVIKTIPSTNYIGDRAIPSKAILNLNWPVCKYFFFRSLSSLIFLLILFINYNIQLYSHWVHFATSLLYSIPHDSATQHNARNATRHNTTTQQCNAAHDYTTYCNATRHNNTTMQRRALYNTTQ